MPECLRRPTPARRASRRLLRRTCPRRADAPWQAGSRRGAVAVEFALVLTLAFLIFFAAFEFCRVAMIRHTVDNAVYEGARRGIVPGGDAAAVAGTARRILSAVGVQDATVTVHPTAITRTTDRITVHVRVPLDSNSFVPANFFRGKVIDRSLSMRREGAR